MADAEPPATAGDEVPQGTKVLGDVTLSPTAEVLDAPDEEEAENYEMLWEVIREGDRATIEALLVGDEEHPPLGCSVDVMDGAGMTPLQWLVVEGHNEVVEWIIDEVGAEVDMRDKRYGQTALHFAATKDQAVVAKQLLERGADAMALDRAGYTPLHAAARAGAVHVAALLAEARPDAVDARGPRAQTPLHRAAFWGRTELCAALLAAGADRGALDADGAEPVGLMCLGAGAGELPALAKLLRSPAPPDYGAAG